VVQEPSSVVGHHAGPCPAGVTVMPVTVVRSPVKIVVSGSMSAVVM
jgi:hypothetical protein